MIFVISGPSGSGKTTLLKKLLKGAFLKGQLIKSVSLTTRPKRPGEGAKRDYIFISEGEFLALLRAKKILEWTKYLGYYYGTPKDFIEEHFKQGNNLLLCLDLKGALKIKRLYPKNTATVFIVPPSLGALKQRIIKRSGKIKQEELRQRLGLARDELLAKGRYDYYLVNKDLSIATEKLKKIITKELGQKQF
ncbi:MAG: guanylate kinase [Candidatus Omnitrophota bacterium]